MKSYILHGENQPQLHKVLGELLEQAKKEELDITRLDWKKSKENDLILAGRSQGLISLGTAVFVDNFFSNNKKAGEIIKSLPKEGAAYIFIENKTLTPGAVKNLQKEFVIQGFPVPILIFNFLGNLMPGNQKLALSQMRQIVDQDSQEFLFIMLSRHIRQLIWIKEDPKTFKGADWQKGKLASQAAKFSKEQLRGVHSKLLEIDRQNKKSQLPENLQASLELLVLGL